MTAGTTIATACRTARIRTAPAESSNIVPISPTTMETGSSTARIRTAPPFRAVAMNRSHLLMPHGLPVPVLFVTLAASLALAGCAATRSTTCSDGKGTDLICPASTHCSTANHRCVTDAEESACAAHIDGDACKLFDADGACHAG